MYQMYNWTNGKGWKLRDSLIYNISQMLHKKLSLNIILCTWKLMLGVWIMENILLLLICPQCKVAVRCWLFYTQLPSERAIHIPAFSPWAFKWISKPFWGTDDLQLMSSSCYRKLSLFYLFIDYPFPYYLIENMNRTKESLKSSFY